MVWYSLHFPCTSRQRLFHFVLLSVLWDSTTEPFVGFSAQLFVHIDLTKYCFFFCCSSTKYSAPKLREIWLLFSPKSFLNQNEAVKDTDHSFWNNWGIILFYGKYYLSGKYNLPGIPEEISQLFSPHWKKRKQVCPWIPCWNSLLLNHPPPSNQDFLKISVFSVSQSSVEFVYHWSFMLCKSLLQPILLQHEESFSASKLFPCSLWYCYILAAYCE